MFEFESEDLTAEESERLGAWLDQISTADVYLLGAGVAALTAGFFLQKQGVQTVILTESDTPGGRLAWKSGPVSISYPALELLAESGYQVQADNSLWLPRLKLVTHLTNIYFQAGGELLSGIIFEKISSSVDRMRLELLFDRRSLFFESVDAIITEPVAAPEELRGPAENLSEKMVLNTGRRSEGWIQAGRQALTVLDSPTDQDLVNGCLLSGRKAAEVALASL